MKEAQEHIIEVAYKLFFKYGISSVTMDHIAKECGMSKRTVYEYFKDKNTLISSIIIYGHQREAQKFSEILKETNNALISLLKLYERNRDFMINVNKTFFTDLKRLYPKIASQFKDIKKSHLCDLSNVLEIGQEQGLFRKELNTTIVATLLFQLMNIIGKLEDELGGKYTIADFHAVSIDCFLRGTLTEKGTEIYLQYKKENKNNF